MLIGTSMKNRDMSFSTIRNILNMPKFRGLQVCLLTSTCSIKFEIDEYIR